MLVEFVLPLQIPALHNMIGSKQYESKGTETPRSPRFSAGLPSDFRYLSAHKMIIKTKNNIATERHTGTNDYVMRATLPMHEAK